MKDKIKGGISALTFLEIIEEPAMKIIGLVQENQWFFGDPRVGSECMKIAADKLEELIKSAQQKMHPTLGESAASDSESNPAPKRVI